MRLEFCPRVDKILRFGRVRWVGGGGCGLVPHIKLGMFSFADPAFYLFPRAFGVILRISNFVHAWTKFGCYAASSGWVLGPGSVPHVELAPFSFCDPAF